MDTVAAQAGGLPEAAPLPVPAGIPPAIVPLPRSTPGAVRDWFDAAVPAGFPSSIAERALGHRRPAFTPTFDHQSGYFYHDQGYFLIN
jgi:hypothetical protein